MPAPGEHRGQQSSNDSVRIAIIVVRRFLDASEGIFKKESVYEEGLGRGGISKARNTLG